MPVAKDPVVAGVHFQWGGDAVKSRIRAGVRAALDDVGRDAVTIARAFVHSPDDSRSGEATGALQAAITYRVPRSEGGGVYTLEFGVDPAIGSQDIGTRPGNPPWEYAFWQETLPPPIGQPYIRPAADIAFQTLDQDIHDRIAFKRGPRAGTVEAPFFTHPFEQGLDQ